MFERNEEQRKLGIRGLPSSRNEKEKEIPVAFYSRVSTEHLMQQSALKNQQEWLQELLYAHPNWKKIGEYCDSGVTGTRADIRPAFQEMYEVCKESFDRGEDPPFRLIVCRDVSRFSRNILDAIGYIKKFRKCGVEIFFTQEGVYTFEKGVEHQINMWVTNAEMESVKISERSLAGQAMSRMVNARGEAPVLYGSGNILGYDLVHKQRGERSNTYKINPEQAETVKMIYQWYLEGNGMKRIVSLLYENHRKNASGEIKWSENRISRILRNKTYAGFIGYFKSYVPDPIEHKRKYVTDESEYLYEQGDWEPIIPLEDWERVQRIKAGKKRKGAKKKGQGKKQASGWGGKLVCACGSTFSRYQWKIEGSETVNHGFECRNIRKNRSRKFHEENGLPGEGRCNVMSMPVWKLDLQFRKILGRLWENPKDTVTTLYQDIEAASEEISDVPEDGSFQRLQNEIKRYELRKGMLLDRLLDSTINEDTYKSKVAEIDEVLHGKMAEMEKIREQQEARRNQAEMLTEKKERLAEVKEMLFQLADFKTHPISEHLIDKLVMRVTPTEGTTVKWYLNLGVETPYSHSFDENDFLLADSFRITLSEAQAYRKKSKDITRIRKWNDLDVEVYIRV